MRSQYDFSKMKGQRNPYASKLKRPITIRLDSATVSYFKAVAIDLGMPYQSLINLFLRDCAANRKVPKLQWTSSVDADKRGHHVRTRPN